MSTTPNYADELAKLDVGDIRLSDPLCEHGTWCIGGPADILVQPHNPEQLSKLLRFLDEHGAPMAVIGDGSNVLFDDAGFRGVIVKIGRRMSAYGIEGTTVWAEAGIAVPRLARAVGSAGLSGMEHTIGIPGTLGGLIAMNGGSEHKSIGSVIRNVRVMDRKGRIRTLSRSKCEFSYRHSIFQTSKDIIIRAKMDFGRRDGASIRNEMLEIIRIRRAKFPLDLPNCGSVFSSSEEMFNTVGPPGRLIEEAGMKGFRVGGAQVSEKHANFIVNTGGATAADVGELIRIAREKVHDRTGYWMACEVKFLPSNGSMRPAHEVFVTE